MRFGLSAAQTGLVLAMVAAALAAEGQSAEPEKGSTPLDPAALFQSASPSVVVVQAELESGSSQGSGVVVAEGEVVTNFHVVKGSRGLLTLKQGSRSWRAEAQRLGRGEQSRTADGADAGSASRSTFRWPRFVQSGH